MRPAPRWTVHLATVLVLLLVAWAYWPGLSGPFLFDDYGNLDVLGAYGRLRDLPSWLFYLSSGTADPTGRPVALLSFLLDGSTWPTAPWPFKRTNLILHLANGLLLATVLFRLQAAILRGNPHARLSRWAPLLGAGLWAAHPFFVSTTLYVVQREAMLPLFFVLAAILSWDRAIVRFGNQQLAAGWRWALLGVGGATLLAGLSKANGFLAPLLVGLCHVWWWRAATPSAARAATDRAAIVCLGIPSVLLLGYLVAAGWSQWSLPVVPGRDWSIPQRLLSEPRVVWEYVGRLALPRAGGGGLFVEDYPASRGWLAPATTLPALATLAISVGLAIVYRKRAPILAFAWLFFLAAHLLESTSIPLELYFEHRNYLPAAMLGWPLAHGLLRPGAHARYRSAFAALLFALLLLLAHQRAQVWGDAQLLGALFAQHEHDSPRAQVNAARQEVERGEVAAGLMRIHAAQQAHPDSVDVAITAIGLECNGTGAVPGQTLAHARATLATVRNWNYGLYEWMQDAASDGATRRCRGFGLDGLASLVDAAETNPLAKLPTRRRDLWHVRARIAIARNRPAEALHWFNAALQAQPDADYALVQAAALGDAGAPGLGVRHLDFYRRLQRASGTTAVRDMAGVHRWLLSHFGYYDRQLAELRTKLADDATSGVSR
jgi:hypothetical protein